MRPLDLPPACIIQAGKKKSENLAAAVVEGRGEGMILRAPEKVPDGYLPVFIGLHPTTIDLFWQTQRAGRAFIGIDNGYFGGFPVNEYFRVTTNALQWFERECPGVEPERFAHFNVDIKPARPWAVRGHILIPLQSPAWYTMMGLDRAEWVEQTCATLRRYTARELRVRDKPINGVKVAPLAEDFERCAAVVAYSSNTLVQASAEGIPVFPLRKCAATPLGYSSVERFEDVLQDRSHFAGRQECFEALASNQWTIEEIAAGIPWNALHNRFQERFQDIA